MSEQQESLNQAEPSPTVDFLRFIALLLRHKLFILLSVFVAALTAAIVSYFYMPNWYSSTVSVIPPKSTGGLDGMMGNITSALKDIGLAKVGGKGGESYSHLVLFNSRKLQDSLIKMFNLAKVYEIPDTNMEAIRQTLGDNFQVTYEAEGNYTITVSHKDRFEAARMANVTVELANSMATDIYKTEAKMNLNYIEKRYQQNQESLNKATDSLRTFSLRYKLISPQDQAKVAFAGLGELKAEAIKQEIALNLLRSTYGEKDPATIAQGKLVEDLRQQAIKAETQPGFAGNFVLDAGAEIAIEYLKRYTDVEIYSKVRAFLTPMYEQSKLDLQRNSPILLVLDAAIPAERKSKPKRSLIVLGAAFGSFLVACMFVILRDRYANLKRKYPELIG